MSDKALNEKLAIWAGFTLRYITIHDRQTGPEFRGRDYTASILVDPQGCEHAGLDFITSETACFKHLVPKLTRTECEVYPGLHGTRGVCFAKVWIGLRHYETYAETVAMALCLAIEKLIAVEGSP